MKTRRNTPSILCLGALWLTSSLTSCNNVSDSIRASYKNAPLYVEAQRLFEEEEWQLSMDKISEELKQHPKNGYAKFLKAIVLTAAEKDSASVVCSIEGIREAMQDLPASDSSEICNAYCVIGYTYQRIRDFDRACENYTRAIDYNVDHSLRPYLGRGELQLYYTDTSSDSVYADFAQALAIDSTNLRANIDMAEAHYMNNDYDSTMLRCCLRATQGVESMNRCFYYLPLWYQQHGCVDECFNALVDALTRKGDIATTSCCISMLMESPSEYGDQLLTVLKGRACEDDFLYLMIGQRYQNEGQLSKAVEWYTLGRNNYPQAAYRAMAQCYIRMGDNRSVAECYDQLLKDKNLDDDERPKLLEKRSLALQMSGQLEEACRSWNEAYYADTLDTKLLQMKARCEMMAGYKNGVIWDCETVLSRDSTFTDCYVYLADTYKKLNDKEKAAYYYKAVAEYHYMYEPIYLYESGKADSALMQIRAYVNNPETPGMYYILLSCMLARMGRTSEALGVIKKAVEYEPGDLASVRLEPDLVPVVRTSAYQAWEKRFLEETFGK